MCPGNCRDFSQFEITMAFQPVVDVVQRDIYAYEALVRGLNGESAGHVLSQVTNENRYGFDQCCRVTAIQLASKLGLKKRLNINFMPNAVYHPQACLQKTIQAARKAGFPANLITFEFTENEEIIDHAHLINIIETYKEYGFNTAIDDFGAGYAGLSLLADLEVGIVKIDRNMIANIGEDIKRQAILKGIMTTAAILDFQIVCEGVETVSEYKFLAEAGIRYMQGYLFAKPTFEQILDVSQINWID